MQFESVLNKVQVTSKQPWKPLPNLDIWTGDRHLKCTASMMISQVTASPANPVQQHLGSPELSESVL